MIGSNTFQKELETLLKSVTVKLEVENFLINFLNYQIVLSFLNQIIDKINEYFETNVIELVVKIVELSYELIKLAVLCYFNKLRHVCILLIWSFTYLIV